MPALLRVPFQQWDSLKQVMTCDTKDKNDPIECEGNNGGNKDSAFPYYNRKTAPTSAEVASMTNANLVKGCYFSNTTTNSSGFQTAPNNNSSSINCYFLGEEVKSDGKVDRFIKGKNNLIVQTGVLPVNFFMYDHFRGGKRYAYDLEDAGIENSNRTDWFRLRILGEPPDSVPEGDPISCGKTRIINTKNNNIDGAFIWLPNGWLEYAKTDSTDTSFNVIWVCKFTAPTKKDKNYQIVTPKTFDAEVRKTLQINLPGFSSASGGTYRAYGSEDSPAP